MGIGCRGVDNLVKGLAPREGGWGGGKERIYIGVCLSA